VRRIPVAALALVLACSGAVAAPRSTSAVSAGAWHFNQATGHLYQEAYGVTWNEAGAYAVKLGGHLATIDDRAEDAWLAATFTDQRAARRGSSP
jgi:hypothetical protein